MVPATRLTAADVGCWVIKSRSTPTDVLPGWAAGETRRLSRCLRRTYRVELMLPGQPCLLWLSGPEQPGVQAIGRLAGEGRERAEPDEAGRESAVEVELRLLAEPVARAALLADPVVSGAEVLRMPAGSNPSYLTTEVWAALIEHIPPAERAAAGW